MQEEVDFEKTKCLIKSIQASQDPTRAQEGEYCELLNIFNASYFVKFSHQMEKEIVKKVQKDRETEFNAIRCFLRAKVKDWDEKIKAWYMNNAEILMDFLSNSNSRSTPQVPLQNTQPEKAARPDNQFKLPIKPDVNKCIQIILKGVNNAQTTVNGVTRQHLYPSQRSRAAVKPKPSATWSTPKLNLENLLAILNYNPGSNAIANTVN